MRLRNHARRRATTRSTATTTHGLDAPTHGAQPTERRALEAPQSPLNSPQENIESRRRTHVERPAGRMEKRPRIDRREPCALENSDRMEEEDMDSPHDDNEDSPASPGGLTTLSRKTPHVPRQATLSDSLSDDRLKAGVATSYYCLLQTAFAQEDRIDETSWLTSTLIDLMLWRLATQYADVHFLATDFCHLHLPSIPAKKRSASRVYAIRDVVGRSVECPSARPIVFVANVGRIHWNLLRVQFHPHAELQLFEPMGRLSSRSGISYRSVPRCVIEWLDACYPQEKSWITRSVSAITQPQQVSGFDCGVACLLYADKCGQGQPREAINASTDQHEITTFRSELQRQLQSELLPHARAG